ncbi:class I SAM-dependent methyltransferase [bacterium]
MDYNKIIQKQFDQQAENFSRWSVTHNTEYMDQYLDFCRIQSNDTFLDIACGTGEFAHYTAARVKQAIGVDISPGMIELAKKNAGNQSNINFLCHNVENLPLETDRFSIVNCRSAFHHMHQYDQIFMEMIRCCQPGGRISIQDIIVYEDLEVDAYFESLEKAIDICHHQTCSSEFLTDLYTSEKVPILQTLVVTVELHFQEYIRHAKQTEENMKRISELLSNGLSHPKISDYFVIKDDDLFFKRNVFLILGQKPSNQESS